MGTLYVDNIISGCKSYEAVLQCYTKSRTIISDAKFIMLVLGMTLQTVHTRLKRYSQPTWIEVKCMN